MKNKITEKQSKAKKVNILLKNYEGRFRSYKEMANFKDPVVMLIRPTTKKVEFFDNATAGWFVFIHSDGGQRKVKLSPEHLLAFPYGKRLFNGYIISENSPTPLPEKPVVVAEQFEWVTNKAKKDIANAKEKEYNAKGDMWYKIIIGLAILVAVLGGVKMFVPDFSLFGLGGTKEVVVQTGEALVRNVSMNP